MFGYEALAEHHRMLADRVRTEAFRDAIHATVRAGDAVCDLGCGTGILSLFACEAGAAHVYAIERTSVAAIASAVVAANGLSERITVLHGEVRGIRLPAPVDVLVSEWIGHAGIEENMLPAVVDARRRLLKPGGRLVPEAVTIIAAPVESATAFAYVGFFDDDVYGFDLRAVGERASMQTSRVDLAREHLLAEPLPQATIDVATTEDARFEAESAFAMQRDGALHGIAVWFESRIGPGVEISTAPGAPRTHWRQLFLPIASSPAPIRRGDVVRLRLASQPSGRVVGWAWSGAVCGSDGGARMEFRRRSPATTSRRGVRPGARSR